MPVRKNSYYNDPALGAAFDSIASVFKPPSGSDLYGYAHAAATRDKALRLQEFFNTAKNPAVDRATMDRIGVGAGAFNPGDSYYKIDTGNQVSRDNNTADNARAIQAAKIKEEGDTRRTLLTPVAQGATRFNPPDIASQFALPAIQSGAIEVKPGERVYAPGGQTYEGPAKPLSVDEVKAADLEKRIASGEMGADLMRALHFGTTPVENIIGPNGETRVGTRPQAIGQEPALAPDKFQISNYRAPPSSPGGPAREGPSRVNARGQLVNAQTNELLPAESTTFTANAQGDKDKVVGTPTTANQTEANKRAAEVTRSLHTIDMIEALAENNPASFGLPGLVRGTIQNAVAVTNDISKAFGKSAPEVDAVVNDMRAGLQRLQPDAFDPSIDEGRFLKHSLAYSIARTENPSGEVSRQAYTSALERVEGGLLSNTSQLKANLNALRKQQNGELEAIGALRDPKAARTDTGTRTPAAPAVSATEIPWVRGEDGQLRRAQ